MTTMVRRKEERSGCSLLLVLAAGADKILSLRHSFIVCDMPDSCNDGNKNNDNWNHTLQAYDDDEVFAVAI